MRLAPVLILGHAALAIPSVVGAALTLDVRHRLVQAIAVVGLALTAALVGLAGQWRTIDLDLPQARIAAAGVGAAWLMVLVGERRRADWYSAACVAIGATGLLMAASNRWLVPLLLFGACSTTALTLLLRAARPSAPARFALVSGDVLIACGLVDAALDAGLWNRPEGVEGWAVGAIVAGTLLRSGALPLTGPWAALATDATPAVPLVVAGGFAIPVASLSPQPWVAVALLTASLVVAGWTLLHREFRLGLVAAWPVMLGLALGFTSSTAQASAGVQATLACSAIALWPWTVGRAQTERGILLSFLPLTLGSAAIGSAAEAAFASASGAPGILAFLPSALSVGLLPLGLLGGVLLGARLGAAGEPEDFEPSAVLAVWALLATAMVVWLVAPNGIGQPAGDGRTLQFGAVLGAVVAGFLARGRSLPDGSPVAPSAPFRHAAIEPRPPARRVIRPATPLVGLAGGVLVVWMTYDGLRYGFL